MMLIITFITQNTSP